MDDRLTACTTRHYPQLVEETIARAVSDLRYDPDAQEDPRDPWETWPRGYPRRSRIAAAICWGY